MSSNFVSTCKEDISNFLRIIKSWSPYSENTSLYPRLATARIKKLQLLLAAYDYAIEFTSGKDNVYPDVLSSKPIKRLICLLPHQLLQRRGKPYLYLILGLWIIAKRILPVHSRMCPCKIRHYKPQPLKSLSEGTHSASANRLRSCTIFTRITRDAQDTYMGFY